MPIDELSWYPAVDTFGWSAENFCRNSLLSTQVVDHTGIYRIDRRPTLMSEAIQLIHTPGFDIRNLPCHEMSGQFRHIYGPHLDRLRQAGFEVRPPAGELEALDRFTLQDGLKPLTGPLPILADATCA